MCSSDLPTISVSPASQSNSNLPSFNPTDFELCIHTCNSLPCRNESQSFLWSRKQASLPRHALSSKKHRRCAPDCPGYRLLKMPVADAMKEPRRARCRPPTEAELALAAEEASRLSSSERTSEQKTEVEGESRREDLGEPNEAEEPDKGSPQEEGGGAQKEGEEDSQRKSHHPSNLGKRFRTREELYRSRRLRPRVAALPKLRDSGSGHDD